MLLERLIATWLRIKALVHRRRLDRDLEDLRDWGRTTIIRDWRDWGRTTIIH